MAGKRYLLVVSAGSVGRLAGGPGPAEDFAVEFVAGCVRPGSLDSPDAATWRFRAMTALADVGDYLVCFREKPDADFVPIPSVDGARSLVVEPLEADRSHARGIFHNQHFSVLAGSSLPRHLSVGGTGLPHPADSRLLLNAHPSGACGDSSRFTGVPLTVPSEDTVVPKPDYTGFFPPATGTQVNVDVSQQLLLAFNEAVVSGPCDGNTSYISLVPIQIGGASSHAVQCDDQIAIGDKVVVRIDSGALATATQYYVRVETGGLLDYAGNPLPILLTDETYIVDTTTDDTVPSVIASNPCDGCESTLEQARFNGTLGDTVVLYLSEDAGGSAGGLLRLFDCLGDLVCDPATDVEIRTVDLATSGAISFGYGVLFAYLGPLETSRRYRLVLDAGALTDTGTSSLTGPAAAFETEFLKVAEVFDFRAMSVTPTKEATAELYTFPLQVPESTAVGVYTVCYCNDQTAAVLEDVFDGETTYYLVDNEKADASETYIPSGVSVVELAASEHQCERKCAQGCTGPYCFCEGFDGTDTPATLCLPPGLCRDACDADPACGGISVHDTLPQCTLFQGAAANISTTVAEAWQTYEKKMGRACTHLHDFQETAGMIEVTSRVVLEVDFVLTPGEEGSIEVVAASGAELTYDHSDVPVHGEGALFTGKKLLSRDRITIVDGHGLCGVSAPSALIELPGSTIEDWMNHVPHSWYREAAHEDEENPPGDDELPYTPTTPEGHYSIREGVYCPGRNLDLSTLDVVFDGTVHSVEEHQCYTKCGRNAPCTGDDCFCQGYYQGYDSPDSTAICADVQLCQYICDQLEACGSIDMHRTLPRCFLNLVGCNSHSEALYTDPNYAILFKRVDPNDEQTGRGNVHDPNARRMLDYPDEGFSWSQMLRFKGLHFTSGGRFKLCFCDSEIHSSCNKASDYGVEVGEVHVSGVSCLVENPRLQRVACAPQHHGGLRCYPRIDDAPMPKAPHVGMTALPSEDAITPLSLLTKCSALSIDEAEHDPECAAILAELYS